MTTRDDAAEQLRVIRTMMERATIFRALSGETALVGGAAALAAAWLSEGQRGWDWAFWWLGFLALVLAFNIFQIARAASQHRRPFWSAGLKLALRGALPSIIAGGFLGLLHVRGSYPHSEPLAACFWILHYGLALLAIREFAPASMKWLAWAFVITGMIAFAGISNVIESLGQPIKALNASQLMAITFGGFHLAYGAVIVTTRKLGNREA